jgi:hypothetical protein
MANYCRAGIKSLRGTVVLKDIFTGGFPEMTPFRSFIRIYQSIPFFTNRPIHVFRGFE